MLKRKINLLIILFIFIFITPPVFSDCKYFNWNEENSVDCDYSSDDFYSMVDYTSTDIDWAQVDQTRIPAERINEVPADKLDFDQLTGEQLGAVTPQQWEASEHNVESIEGDSSGADVEGSQLILTDGSTYDLDSGSNINVEIGSDGSTKSFSNDLGVSFFNAKGVIYTKDQLSIQQADSLSWYGTTANIISNFIGQSGTFKVDSADRVIIETMTFDKIINSEFTLSDGNLIEAKVVCNKNNSETSFPNLIGSNPIKLMCDKDENYDIEYRTTPNQIYFDLSEGINLTLKQNDYFVIFDAIQNAEIKIKSNGTFEIKNGILSYITNTFEEQLEGNCGDFSTAEIDLNRGFLKTILVPESTSILCPGARYNRIYKTAKENSFSIFNIGNNPYFLIFDKDIERYNDLLNQNKDKDNHGFVSETIILNGNIQYDRYPEKDLFPAITLEEYNVLPLSWKKVYASYEENTRTNIKGTDKIIIDSKNDGNGTGNVLVEINSGWFNIKEKQTGSGIRRFANFNKNMTYPDYIQTFRFNNEPIINIKNQTLEQNGLSKDGNEKVVKMFTPASKEQSDFLDWLEIRTVVKDLSEFIQKLLNK